MASPIASFTLNNTLTNLNTGTVSNNQSYNYIQSGPANYKFNPITTGTPTTLANNHPTLTLNGYVGGVMVTATGGSTPPFTNYTKPYVITNLTGQPGDVSIFLPGDSSEMLAFFNVGSVNAPTNGMTSSNYVFGSLNGPGLGLNRRAARTSIRPNFAARAAAVFDNGANIPVSSRNGQSLASIGGYANQQLVTAGSRRRKHVRISDLDLLRHCQALRVQIHSVGFLERHQRRKQQRSTDVRGSGRSAAVGCRRPGACRNSSATGTATYTGHAIANIATPNSITSYLAAGAFSATANFATRTGTVTIAGLDGTNYAGTAMQAAASPVTFGGVLNSMNGPGSVGGRTATLAGSFFQGGPTNSTPAYGEIGGSLILNGTGGYLGSGIFAARKP